MSKKRGPQITFTDQGVQIVFRDQSLDVPVYESEEADVLIELDKITHYASGADISLEDLGRILAALEEAAEAEDLSIEFD